MHRSMRNPRSQSTRVFLFAETVSAETVSDTVGGYLNMWSNAFRGDRGESSVKLSDNA